MKKRRAISLNIILQASDADMEDENKLRTLCIQRMYEILGVERQPYITTVWEKSVTIEPFQEDVDDEEMQSCLDT